MSVSFLAKSLAAMTFMVAGASVCAQGMPSVSRQIFSEADANRDGFVSLDEFHKDVIKSFRSLDFDGDGFITLSELEGLSGPEQVKVLRRMIRRADTDGDGKLSFREVVVARMKYFDEADTNRDEQISLEEALAFDANMEKKMAQAREARKASRASDAGKAR
jgi:hypothetical protein